MKSWKINPQLEVHRILTGRCNVYLIHDEDRFLLVDTGKKSQRKILQRKLTSLGIRKIQILILTHTHYDHCQNAAWLKKHYHCSIVASRAAKNNILKGFSPLPMGTMRFSKFMVRLASYLPQKLFKYETFHVNTWVDKELRLPDSKHQITVIATPGHSADSLSIILENQIALVGDSLFGIFHNNIMPPFADNNELMQKQWTVLSETACSLFLPGHGQPVHDKLLHKFIGQKQ